MFQCLFGRRLPPQKAARRFLARARLAARSREAREVWEESRSLIRAAGRARKDIEERLKWGLQGVVRLDFVPGRFLPGTERHVCALLQAEGLKVTSYWGDTTSRGAWDAVLGEMLWVSLPEPR